MKTRRHKPLRHHLHDYFFPHARNGYRPHLFRLASVTTIVVAVLLLELAYVAQLKLVFSHTGFLAAILPGVLVDLTNDARAVHAAPAVARNALLDAAAQAAAEDMAARGYFAHVSPEGREPWYWLDQVGYAYSYAGQNLAVNFTDSREVQNAWLASPTHYANVVKSQYTEVGFGIAQGVYEGRETTFVVEFFGTPIASRAAVAISDAPAPAVVATKPAVTTLPTKQILGSESVATAVPTPHASSWLSRVFTAPTSSMAILFATCALLIATLFSVALVVRGTRLKHANLVVAATLLLMVFSGSIFFDSLYTGPVGLPADARSASVVSYR